METKLVRKTTQRNARSCIVASCDMSEWMTTEQMPQIRLGQSPKYEQSRPFDLESFEFHFGYLAQRFSGFSPVCLAIRASMRGPISSPS